ncbi:tetratricopeptide repeat protein [bacterium]|nr:tetratricopeptide repeat protein [bacterium]MBP9807878.1 tetratricopeptide repeat protein [bacterium]
MLVFLNLSFIMMSFSGAFATTEVTSLQNKALTSEQPDWLAHETMSCSMWRQANLYEAIREGKEACRLAPENAVVLINLGLMLQATDDSDAAIACYERAGRIDRANYLPYLGIARCWIIKGDEAKGIKLLEDMSSRQDAGFDWYYAAAQTCLKIKQNDLAERLIRSAMSAATAPEQLANARNSLFLIELRRNRLEQARELYKKVFDDCPPTEAEIYVRAASAVLKTDDPASGKVLLSCATKNLKTIQDSKAFFMLGRIFQDKVREVSARGRAKDLKARWLVVSRDAYSQAIVMAPKVSEYVLARADVLMQEGKLSEMFADLKAARDLSNVDPLPSFILDNLTEGSSANIVRLKRTKLVKAKLSIAGLSCDCHLSKFLGTMRNNNGVAFISASGRKVFSGEIIYAPSIISIDDLISKTREEFFKVLPPKKSAEPLSIAVLAEEPVAGLADVFKQSCEARHGPVVSFQESLVDYYNRFNDIQPTFSIGGTTPAGRGESPNAKY